MNTRAFTAAVMAVAFAALLFGADLGNGLQFTSPQASSPASEAVPQGGAASAQGLDVLPADHGLPLGIPEKFWPNQTANFQLSENIDAVLQRAGVAPEVRLPLPTTPAGPAPLAVALEDYLRTIGAASPGLAALQASAEKLPLGPGGEAALSRIVLAYSRALEAQAGALDNLALADRELLAGTGEIWRNATISLDEREALLDEAASRVDRQGILQAADLLSRTVEEARLWLRPEAALLPAISEPSRLVPDLSLAGWATVDAVLDLAALGEPTREPPVLGDMSLAQALALLAKAYGAPAPVGNAALLLPPSLDHAVAGIVQAQAVGMQRGSVWQAQALVQATKAAEPVVLAWAELLRPGPVPIAADIAGFLQAAVGPLPTPQNLLEPLVGHPLEAPGAPLRLATSLEAAGVPRATAQHAAATLPPNVAAALALILAAETNLGQAHLAAASAVTPEEMLVFSQSAAVIPLLQRTAWSTEEAALVLEWALVQQKLGPKLAEMDAAQVNAVAAIQAAQILLAQTPPLPNPNLVPDAGLTTAHASSTSNAASPPDPLCPTLSPLSDCANDVFLQTDAGRGIVITGRGSSVVGSNMAGGDPHIVLDLGGNDVYFVPMGAATKGFGVPSDDWFLFFFGGPLYEIDAPNFQPLAKTQENLVGGHFLSVAIDVGGDDEYRSAAVWAQGAARGLGTVGVLWDVVGNDTYVQETNENEPVQFAQGVGLAGGLGLLVDGAGNDRYEAKNGIAQGVGYSPLMLYQFATVPGSLQLFGGTARSFAGTGVLLDLGSGNDDFHARGGQGHSIGVGTVGVLVDLQGPTKYAVLDPTFAYQGGRGLAAEGGVGTNTGIPSVDQLLKISPPTQAGGLAILIDLGGDGDTYTSPLFDATDPDAAGMAFMRPAGRPLRKDDDALWKDGRRATAFGLDSSLMDSDDDGVPDVVELLSQSDPDNAASVPRDPNTIVAALTLFVLGGQPGSPSELDTDGDGWPDVVERSLGTDPNRTESQPGLEQVPGLLAVAGALCPEDEPTQCGGGALCDPVRFDCIRLLIVGDSLDTRHDRRAIVVLDLGGNDVYNMTVAGDGAVRSQGPLPVVRGGSTNIDFAGNDRYGETPGRNTQAFSRGGASILLDLAGDDRYMAVHSAQASVLDTGLALLGDLSGNDEYISGAASQAHAARDAEAEPSPADALYAFLIDAAGNDRYTFFTQAAVMGRRASSLAILLDAAGQDRYTSSETPVEISGPTAQYPATIFETQGRLERSIGPNQVFLPNGALTAIGAFVDAGQEQDTYLTRTPSGTLVSVPSKNDVGLRRNPTYGAAGPWTGDRGTAAAYFGDGLAALAGDADQDQWPMFVEMLLGSDPDNAQSAPIRLDYAASPPHPFPWIARIEPRAALLGSAGDNLALPGLLIAGLSDDVHSTYLPFVIDLGGNDVYSAPYAGGASALLHNAFIETPVLGGAGSYRFATSLLLDVGAGNDTYAPAPCKQTITTNASLIRAEPTVASGEPYGGSLGYQLDGKLSGPFCPSLGGAITGVSVLADLGGTNSFRSSLSINVTAASNGAPYPVAKMRAWGVTQGASLFHGAGLLFTWDSQNEFSANVSLRATELNNPLPAPIAEANGVAQGAAWGHGVGILANFGTGNDTYSANVTASAPRGIYDYGRAWAVAQGAAQSGTGVLIDGGGNNSFWAPAGFAQAATFAMPFIPVGSLDIDGAPYHIHLVPLGILISGNGRDHYAGGVASQASAGILSTIAATFSGVSVERSGIAILEDGGGDDSYTIAGSPPAIGTPLCAVVFSCALSQAGAHGAGRALLLDWAGNDVYRAPNWTHVQAAKTNNGTALLLDLSGHDSYSAKGFAKGFGGVGLPQIGLTGEALFIDAAGHDKYSPFVVGQISINPTGNPTGSPDGSGWVWQQGLGLGVDADSLETALEVYRSRNGPPLATVSLRASLNSTGIGTVENQTVAGVVYFFVKVQNVSTGFVVQRVDLMSKGELLGEAMSLGDGNYSFAWDTASPQKVVVDGNYSIVAIAMVSPLKLGSGSVEAPGGGEVPSAKLPISVDNPPTGVFSLSVNRVSPNRTATHPKLSVTANPDFSNKNVTIHVDLIPAKGPPIRLYTPNVQAGQINFTIDGACNNGPCADGQYNLTVTLVGADTRSTNLGEVPLLIDGTAPVSSVLLGSFAGRDFEGAGGRLVVPWTVVDPWSGPDKIRLDTYSVNGQLLGSLNASAADGQALVPAVDGQSVILVLNANDTLGNQEKNCEFQNVTECIEARLVTVDFNSPVMGTPHVVPDLIGPGRVLRVEVHAEDAATGVQGLEVTVDGARSIAPQKMEELEPGNFSFEIILEPGEPEEAAIFAHVVGVDEAGNEAAATLASGMLDTLKPRLGQPTVTYRDGATVLRSGRPGLVASVDINVTDYAMDAVKIIAPSLNQTDATNCERNLESEGNFSAWMCLLTIPTSADQGNHTLTVQAWDLAGNDANETTATIIVDADPVATVNVTISAIGPDSLTVSWTTDRPATSRVDYGRSQLNQSVSDDELRLNHQMKVSKLTPGTTYKLRAVSITASGQATSSLEINASTSPGFAIEFEGFVPGSWAGVRQVPLQIVSYYGNGSVELAVQLENLDDKVTFPLTTLRLPPGSHELAIETRDFPDGRYNLSIFAKRGDDLPPKVYAPVFEIDNTPPVLAPSSPRAFTRISEPRPILEAYVLDPHRAAPPNLTTLRVLVNGQAIAIEGANMTSLNGTHRVSARPLQPLHSQSLNVSMAMTDAAGNAGAVEWSFTIDQEAPKSDGRPILLGGSSFGAFRPGQNATLRMRLLDGSGVASAWLRVNEQNVSLASAGLDEWTTQFQVPPSAPDGRLTLTVFAVDGLNNTGIAGEVVVLVDRAPPRFLNVAARALNMTAVEVSVTTDELATVIIEVKNDGSDAPGAGNIVTVGPDNMTAVMVPHSLEFVDFAYRIIVGNLTPGRTVGLLVILRDEVGNKASSALHATLPADTSPPSSVGNFTAVSDVEGMVRLNWEAATDDSGIGRYEIRRWRDAGVAMANTSAGSLSYEEQAPAGRSIHYEIRAIDLGGNAGPFVSALVDVLSLPHLTRSSILPDQGYSTDRFEVRVIYSHAAGLLPDRVTLHYGALAMPLHLSGLPADCVDGCPYSATVRLPPRSTFAAAPTVIIEASVGGQNATLQLAAPLVIASDEDLGLHAGEPQAAPAPGLILVLAAMMAALVLLRRKRIL